VDEARETQKDVPRTSDNGPTNSGPIPNPSMNNDIANVATVWLMWKSFMTPNAANEAMELAQVTQAADIRTDRTTTHFMNNGRFFGSSSGSRTTW
jgi:hypothetical protein